MKAFKQLTKQNKKKAIPEKKQLSFRHASNDLIERAANRVIESNKKALLILKDR
jgi:hypothetical protein